MKILPASYRCMEPMTMLAIAGMAYSGFSAYQQGQEQKKMYEEQAQIAQEEANAQATQKEDERRRMLANQRMAYLANGVSISGTPLIVGQDTWNQYQMEIDALRKSGVSQSNLLRKQGSMAATSGRTKLVTSLLTGGSLAAKGGLFSSSPSLGDGPGQAGTNANPNGFDMVGAYG